MLVCILEKGGLTLVRGKEGQVLPYLARWFMCVWYSHSVSLTLSMWRDRALRESAAESHKTWCLLSYRE